MEPVQKRFGEVGSMTNPKVAPETLARCPFCDGMPELHWINESGEVLTAWVGCQCGAEFRESRTKETAREKWNTRALSAPAERLTGEALLAAEDERQTKLHELLETIREQIRTEISPEHRPEGLFKNIQDAVYAMRGRTRLLDDAAIVATLASTIFLCRPTGTIHKLKTWPEYFNEVLSGRKPFEWRIDDRDFKLGDTLVLQEYIPNPENPGREGKYTGREITKNVSYIFSPWATNKRTVIMGLAAPALTAGTEREVIVPHEDCLNCSCAEGNRCAGYQVLSTAPAASGADKQHRSPQGE